MVTNTLYFQVDPSVDERTIIMSATTKTFNIAGSHTGNVIIKDDKLRHKFAERMMARYEPKRIWNTHV